MKVNMDFRRATFAWQRVRTITEWEYAKARRSEAAKAISLLIRSNLPKAFTTIQSKYKVLFADIEAWYGRAGEDDGPMLPADLKENANKGKTHEYLLSLDSRRDYLRIFEETLAFLAAIKSEAEAKKNMLPRPEKEPEGESNG